MTPLDPAAGFPMTPGGRVEERLRELERRLAAFRGAAAAGGISADTITVGESGINDYGGPYADLHVPEGGAWVEIYGEAEARMTAAGTVRGGVAELVGPNTVRPRGSYLQWTAAAGTTPTPWVLRRQNGNSVSVPANGQVAGNTGDIAGVVMRFFQAVAGDYRYLLWWQSGGDGGVAEIRNRRLAVRVAQ